MKIKENIFWAGYIDWELRNFHGYSTPYGSTYNSYLILDKEPVLIDTVKKYGFSSMLEDIRQVIDPSKIKYIISNHTEMDHSGSIPELLKYCPNAVVVCSPKGKEGLARHFKQDFNFKVVNTGDTLSTGKYTFKFFLDPMVHWPDSMATYLVNEKILFSNDAFGQHYASNSRFSDEAGLELVYQEAKKYYANIVMPYGQPVLNVLEAVKGLEIEMICPSHGFIWRDQEPISRILSLYKRWASYESDKKAVVIYDTMWHSTESMALRLRDFLSKQKIAVKIFNLQETHISDIITEVMDSKMVCLGTPILNNKMLPTVAAFLTYTRGLKPRNRYGFSFGSYGWSKAGFKEVENGLKEAGMELPIEGKYINYVPDESELESLSEIAGKIKDLLK